MLLSHFWGPLLKAIYTTNAIESLNSVIRKATKSKNYFQRMTRLKKSSIWQYGKLVKNGPCQSVIGNPYSIGLSLSSKTN